MKKSFQYVHCYLYIYELEKDIPYKYLYSIRNGGDLMKMNISIKVMNGNELGDINKISNKNFCENN